MVLINCDMGESFGIWRLGDDAALMPEIDLANIACGFHGSDFNHMRRTVVMAREAGVRVGAHPSLPDLQGFGRREMKMEREELANCLIYQIGALKGFLEAEGVPLHHIKPHGSLFGMAARLPEIAHAICDAADVFRVPLIGRAGTLHATIYPERGHRFLSEFYADLDYADDGSLVITREHPPVEPEAGTARCLRAVREGRVRSLGGVEIETGAETICIHSDTPGAPELARRLRQALKAEGLLAA